MVFNQCSSHFVNSIRWVFISSCQHFSQPMVLTTLFYHFFISYVAGAPQDGITLRVPSLTDPALRGSVSHSTSCRQAWGLAVRMPCAQTPPLVSWSPTTLSEPSSTPVHLHSRRAAITVRLTDLLGGVKEVTCTWEPSPAPVRCPVNSELHIDCSVSDRIPFLW